MTGILRGRMAAEIDGDFVIYINGFRLNNLRAFPKWFRAGRKIAVMFEELAEDPDSGFLWRVRYGDSGYYTMAMP